MTSATLTIHHIAPDPVRLRQWIEALRSGNYKQGQGALRTSDDCFCCLGVLADQQPDKNWVEADSLARHGDYGFNTPILPVTAKTILTSEQVSAFLGCDEMTASSIIELWRDNDQGKSFNYIADALEALTQ